MTRPHHSAAAIAPTAATARRTGRPRRNLRLSAPTVSPLLGTEHQDALAALSALLGEPDSHLLDDSAAQPAREPADGTLRILEQLSSPDATIMTPTPRRRVA